MGQSINVLLYGVRVPKDIDDERLIEKWRDLVTAKVDSYRARLDAKHKRWNWGIAEQAYIPRRPNPDDAEPDELLGFFICSGDDDRKSSHDFPPMTFSEMRTHPTTAKIIKRCRRRWSRFARWARTYGVELGKPRIWRTRTEVA